MIFARIDSVEKAIVLLHFRNLKKMIVNIMGILHDSILCDLYCTMMHVNSLTFICNKEWFLMLLQVPLHLACRSGNVETVKCLLKHGADVHSKDKRGKVRILCIARTFGRKYYLTEYLVWQFNLAI